MAKCEKIIPEQAPPPPVYRLELTALEAEAVCSLLGATTVSARPGGPNWSLERVFNALDDAFDGKRRHLSWEEAYGNIAIRGWRE